MSYLIIDSKVSISDNPNVSQAKSLQKQEYLISPPLSIQAGKSFDDVIQPGYRLTVANINRTLLIDNTTELKISNERSLEPTTWRLQHTGTGTAPGFRTKRTIGLDATSSIRIQIESTSIARIDAIAGTALNTSNISLGDTLLIERTTDTYTSGFSTSNQGIPVTVTGKGSNYIDVSHNGVFVAETGVLLGVNFANAIRVFSTGYVQIGDILELGDGFNFGNQKKVSIILVRDDYIEFTADDMVAETKTDIELKIFDRYINHITVKSTSNVDLYIDDNIVHLKAIDASGTYACLCVNATKLELVNPGNAAISVALLYSTNSGSC